MAGWFCGLLLAASLALAQHYPILPVAGAPQNITMLFQDSTGRIWVGANSDLYLFDGSRFYSMRGYGFPREQVQAMTEDAEGGIWAITDGGLNYSQNGVGGIYRYADGHVEKKFSTGGLQLVHLSKDYIVATIQSSEDPRMEDLVAFHRETDQWKSRLLLKRAVFARSSSAGPGGIVFGCDGAWCELTRQQVEDWPAKGVQPIRHPIAGLADYPSTVMRDKFGCVWARTGSAGWFGCGSDGKLSQVPANFTPLTVWENLLESPDGKVLNVGTSSVVYGRLEGYQRAGAMNDVPNDLSAALIAHDGTIWLANPSGLYRFLYPFRMEYWNQTDGVEYPNAILRASGKMLLGSAGIETLNPDRRRWDTIASTQALGTIRALGSGADGTVFAAANGPGLNQLTPDGKILASSSNRDRVFSLAQDTDGQLWAGGKGIFLARKQDSLFQLQGQNLGRDSVLAMKVDTARNTLWSCNWREVLAHKDGRWLHLGAKDGLNGLRTNFCSTIAVHPDGDVWFSYGGLARFSRIKINSSSQPTVNNYDSGADIGSANNSFLDIDSNGWLWRGSDANYVAAPASAVAGAWLRLDQNDGIPVPGGNPNTFYGDSDGSVWWGSGNTVVHFSPSADFAVKFPVPQIFVSGFSGGIAAPLVPAVGAQIPYGQQVIAHVGSLQFDRRNALELRWRLLPGQSWHTSRGLDLPLGKLHWGRHALQVQGRMAIGPVASEWSTLDEQTFIVARPIWLTWPVIGGMASALLTLFTCCRAWLKKKRARARKVFPELGEWRLEALSPELHRLLGEVLEGRFVVGQLIARGGFASVVKGEDLLHGARPCAIKIFRHELIEKDWMEKRFQHEVESLERIVHHNVVKIYGHGRLPAGTFFLAMEFIEGETLRERMNAGPLPAPQVAAYLRQAGEALAAIHAHGICHRDVKPENLMIRTHYDPGDELVLIDFSIAILKDPDETLHGLSRAAGTLTYMAPEQAIGYATNSTDIYSLTKVLVEMIAGERLSVLLPDAAMDLPQRVYELLERLPVSLSPESLKLISSALEFDPGQRPHDVRAFASCIADDLKVAARD
jgi:tRNA A-37 threonylcarbamoyl transferase component Bud32